MFYKANGPAPATELAEIIDIKGFESIWEGSQ